MPQISFQRHVRRDTHAHTQISMCHFQTSSALLLVTPMFILNVWHEVVLFNFFNVALFNIRSRALNSAFYSFARILASLVFQVAVDMADFESLKGRIWFALLPIIIFLSIGLILSGSVFLGLFSIIQESEIDYTEPRAIVVMGAFFAYGALETLTATFSFWILGAWNFGNSHVINRYVGWYRMCLNLGGTISWALDIAHFTSYFTQWVINLLLWLLNLSCICLLANRATKHQKDSPSKQNTENEKIESEQFF